jgi:hypothetical protein
MLRRALVVLGSLAVCVGLATGVAWAESFADLYLGAAITHDIDGVLIGPSGGLPVRGSFDTSLTVGGRLGHYFERLPWLGLAFDASFWLPDAKVTVNGLGTLDQIDLTVVPLSALMFVRVPGLLPTAEAPQGRVQPYLAVGTRPRRLRGKRRKGGRLRHRPAARGRTADGPRPRGRSPRLMERGMAGGHTRACATAGAIATAPGAPEAGLIRRGSGGGDD